jgi:hypothetical protein
VGILQLLFIATIILEVSHGFSVNLGLQQSLEQYRTGGVSMFPKREALADPLPMH